MIATPHHYLISVYRAGLYFVSVCTSEMMPLFVIEFLHRVVDTFKDYFGDCTESLIKEHYVVSCRAGRQGARCAERYRRRLGQAWSVGDSGCMPFFSIGKV